MMIEALKLSKDENKKSWSLLKANAKQGQAQLPVPRGNDDDDTVQDFVDFGVVKIWGKEKTQELFFAFTSSSER